MVAGVAALLLVVVAAVLLVRAGEDESTTPRSGQPTAKPSLSTTSLAAYDTTDVVVARADFCPAISQEQAELALGEEVAEAESYANGDRAEVAPGVTDVAHEYACTWRGTAHSIARGWVFAPPVTPERARELADAAAAPRGCRTIRDAPAFGSVSTGVLCRTGPVKRVVFQGLFGDAWLSCALTRPRSTSGAEVEAAAGQWCVAVARAASSGPLDAG
ncbi:unannotated protein [freshwater metagenome]|uniref:Unannotated protein n=1 Tax=freshwater metagenome TaxID=449393 RepID=A0A6J6PB75_9ZZZZ